MRKYTLDYEVVVREERWSGIEYRCKNLGHGRYQCGKCKKGYFSVMTEHKYDDKCPECCFIVIVRRDEGRKY